MNRPVSSRSPTDTPTIRIVALGTSDAAVPVLLLAVAAAAWWFTIRQSGQMTLSLGVFLIAWAAMMAAMMLPAVAPVVRLYARAAAAGRVAPAGFFVSGYLGIWVLSGLPAYVLWRSMGEPLMAAEPWALRTAGVMLVAAALYQLSPLKQACLRHCRSPMTYFMRGSLRLSRPAHATWAGAVHGFSCFGCCVALMLVLITAAAMQPLWAAVIAAIVFVERNLGWGESFARLMAIVLGALGAATLIHPALAAALI